MKLLHCLIFGLMLGAISACSTPEVKSGKRQTIDFSALKTFNWLTTTDTSNEVGTGPASERVRQLDRQIRTAVEKELKAKGFRKEETIPDFLVDYQIGWKVESVRRHQGWSYIDEDSLVLRVREPRKQRIFWQGRVPFVVREDKFPSPEETDAAVKTILKNIPPAST